MAAQSITVPRSAPLRQTGCFKEDYLEKNSSDPSTSATSILLSKTNNVFQGFTEISCFLAKHAGYSISPKVLESIENHPSRL
jgi:hypothetical protein